MKYEIGQSVWWATCQSSQRFETCPDCGGTGRLRVIFHDETQVSIECRNCASGYDAPTGKVLWYGRIAEARPVVITGFECSDGKVTWRSGIGSGSYYSIDDDALFTGKAEAEAHAEKLAAEANTAEQARILTREKDARTWAWNASYHRRLIKQAEKDIAYHTAKLAVAKIKAKEPETV